ncbi:MAG: hypothetical protein KJ042_05630 [Deltaproteobacteria bacterium]|nr:hypothetical protein [Deltaproteobacteria bacterium]
MTAAVSNNQKPTANDPGRRALNRRLHACAARIAAATGQDAGEVKADFVASVTRETRLAGRATTHSSELADDELRRVVYRISTAADRCGAPSPLARSDGRGAGGEGGPTTKNQKPTPRLPKGVARLRTKEQEHVLGDLCRRLFRDHLGAPQLVFSAVLKDCPDSSAARAKIDELKSRLVREARLPQRAARLLVTGAHLPMREKNVLHQVSAAAGRKVNALPVGAVLWVFDLVDGAVP